MKEWEESLSSQSRFRAGPPPFPPPFSMPTDAVKHILLLAWKGEPQGELCWPQQTICASFFNVSSIITLQKREKKKKKPRRTHYRTHDTTVPLPLTINPGYSNAFKECNPQKAHTTGCIVVKELKHIHATLEEKRKEGQRH